MIIIILTYVKKNAIYNILINSINQFFEIDIKKGMYIRSILI
jgi:hypothetical protein